MDSSLRATESSPQQSALLCQVEQCNGSADCRKSAVIGGTMCPTYKLSHDELQSTRARANILREFLAHKDEPMSPVDTVQLREVLLSCLACKACKRECPSGVDMTHLRALALQYIYSKEGMPLRTWLVAHNADIQRLGSFVPHLYNFFATNRLTSSVLKKMAGFAKETSIPPIAVRNPLKRKSDFAAVQQQSGLPKRRSVFLFLDEFTRYQEPHLADTFILLLNRLGYEVVTAEYTESGRAAISKGHLKLARRYAEKNVRLFKDKVSADMPLVGIEPSCILTFRDEYPDLVPSELRTAAIELGNHCLLFDEFLMQETERGNIRREQFSRMPVEIWLHGHCHQKALVGTEKTAALLSLPENAVVHTIQSGCCGMAGSFGYEKEHYKTSIEIGEMLLFPAVRQAVENGTAERPALIAAPGISCRTHILRGTGIKAQHPIEILYKLLT